MAQVRQMTCINCPVGCLLTATLEGDEVRVEGNSCPLGAKYGAQEMTDPRRTVTTDIAVDNGVEAVTSVRTSAPVPKAMIGQVLSAIHAVRVRAPVKVGEVVMPNVCATGADVLITRAVPSLPEGRIN